MRKRGRKSVTAFPATRMVVACALALASGTAAADEGRIPIPWARSVGPPFNITAPGKYYLTGNYSSVPGPLLIGASDVEVDLNGFRLEQTGGASPAVVSASGVNNVVLRNGTLVGPNRGVQFVAGRGLVMEDVKIDGSVVLAVHLIGVSEFALRRLVIDSGNEGIVVVAGPSFVPVQGTIEDCLIESNTGGIDVGDTAGIAILNNRLRSEPWLATYSGIRVFRSTGCLVSNNTVHHPNQQGIVLVTDTSGCLVTGNTVTQPTAQGIAVDVSSLDNLIARNVVVGSGADGILVEGDGNRIEDNLTARAAGFGLHLTAASAGNVFRGNTGTASAGVGCLSGTGTPNLCDDGTANVNGGGNVLP